jgi:hypothetical protein
MQQSSPMMTRFYDTRSHHGHKRRNQILDISFYKHDYKSNEVKSNQIKSNEVKSNQMK